MDGEKSGTPTDGQIDFSLWDDYLKKEDPILSLLYPELSSSEFEKDGYPFEKEKNPIRKAVDAYTDLPVKPFVRKSKRSNAYEIGLRFDF